MKTRLLMLSLTFALALSAIAAPAHAKDAPTPVAAVGSVAGAASYQAAGTAGWTPALAGQKLAAGDLVKTEANGIVVVAYSDGSKSQIGSNSQFTVETLAPEAISVKVAWGVLESWVKKLSGRRRFQVRTPTAVAAVRGTQFLVTVTQTGATTVDCFSGLIASSNNLGQTVDVAAGFRASFDAAGTAAPVAKSPPTVTPTAEPSVKIPEPLPAPAAPKKAEAQPTKETAVEPAKQAEPLPPPNPTQDSSTVSPSSP